jgi:nitrate reductase NapE component
MCECSLYLNGQSDCAVCDTGYASSSGYVCKKCNSGISKLKTAVAAVALVVAVAACIFILRELLRVTVQRQPSSLQRSLRKVETKLAKIPFQRMRIPIVVLQVLTGFFSISGVIIPAVFARFVSWLDFLLVVDPRWLLGVGCVFRVSFYTKLVATTVLPLVVTCILGVTYAVVRARVSRITSARAQLQALSVAEAKHARAFLVLTFLIFPITSTAVFQTFACDYLQGSGQSWLRADYSISCTSTAHRAYQAYGVVMVLVYPVGIPLLYTYILWCRTTRWQGLRADGITPTDRGLSRQVHSSLKSAEFLWSPYKPHAYWWELAECIRRLALTGFLVFIAPGDPGKLPCTYLLAGVHSTSQCILT